MRIPNFTALKIFARRVDMLDMFEWNSSYATGIGSIDAQHQALFQTAAMLHQGMVAGKGKAALGSILERLVRYTESHFAHEERLMSVHNYPGLAAHKVQHDTLCRQVREFQEQFQSGQATITVQLLHFLKNWLVEHIQGSDLKYAPFLAKKAVA
jgi:hemerythrin